jgi:hypothetical protein
MTGKAALRLVTVCMSIVVTNVASAQSVKMFAITDLVSAAPTPQVIGANPADPTSWPATFVFRNVEGGGCTATAVGQRVVLTAAHCVEDAAKAWISVRGVSAELTCSSHPAYPADISADFSLCLVAKELPKPGAGFERVNGTEPAAPAQGQAVTLLGYGCTNPFGTDRSFGTLYEGTARVAARPDRNLYIRTNGGAAVCFGDSGGGSYYATTATGTQRALFGVNSRGDISKNSWISATATTGFIDWARAWSKSGGVKICGLDANAEDCRP